MTHVLAELLFVAAGLIGGLVTILGLRTATLQLMPLRRAAGTVIVVQRRHRRLRTGGQSHASLKRAVIDLDSRAA